ncbi:MAG: hypothetical protein V2B18_24905 [Pseudomonadota bacterium]
MPDMDSPHLRLQQQIDCNLEVHAGSALETWQQDHWKEEPFTDADEAPLKYIALVLLDAIEHKAVRLSVEKDEGVTVFADEPYPLPKAPPEYIARCLEIIREIAGMERGVAEGTLSLGIRNDSLELIIQKEGGTHMINIPGVGTLSGA